MRIVYAARQRRVARPATCSKICRARCHMRRFLHEAAVTARSFRIVYILPFTACYLGMSIRYYWQSNDALVLYSLPDAVFL